MKNANLKKYLTELLIEEADLCAEDKAVLDKLISLTLQFRDQWLDEKNETLTVGETKEAIGIYSRA